MASTAGIFGGSVNKLNVDFSKDIWIETVIIDSEFGLDISSVTGKKISTIEISGINVTFKDLCMFTSVKKLPKLSHVEFNDATLLNFRQHQFCNHCEPSQVESRDIEVRF